MLLLGEGFSLPILGEEHWEGMEPLLVSFKPEFLERRTPSPWSAAGSLS